MSYWLRLTMVSVLLLFAGLCDARANTSLEDINDLPPGEKYRQLSLIVLLSGGADPALVDALLPRDTIDQSRSTSNLTPDDYTTPLIRIVDQESMLSGSAFLLRFAQQSSDEIQTSLAEINANNPVLISMVDMTAITEDAIIIRNAIADAISYSSIVNNEQNALYLHNYRTQTIRLRNIMEYELFDVELDRLTQEAILSVGGKLDAYQRMFDEEVNSKDLDRQFDAAKYIFNRTEKFDEKAGMLTEEIMKNVILSQSKPNTP